MSEQHYEPVETKKYNFNFKISGLENLTSATLVKIVIPILPVGWSN